MVNRDTWIAAAKARLKKYEKDRGLTGTRRAHNRHEAFIAADERGAGRELATMADRVPPV